MSPDRLQAYHAYTRKHGVNPILYILAFAPFGIMAFWLVRLRLGKRLRSAFEALPAAS